jgi:hypothetical protein
MTTPPDDPVLRFLVGEFASLRAQMATMTRQELLALGTSLLAPALLLLYGLFLLIVPEATASKPEEQLYVCPADPKRLLPLPPALDPTKGPAPAPAVALSIVVPAYNEKLRLPQMLKDVHEFLAAADRTRVEAFGASVPADVEGWEVILVDDGSEDGTDLIALSVGHEWEKIGWAGIGKGIGKGELRVVKLEANRGKGGAVKHVRPCPYPSVALRDESSPPRPRFLTGRPAFARSTRPLCRCGRRVVVPVPGDPSDRDGRRRDPVPVCRPRQRASFAEPRSGGRVISCRVRSLRGPATPRQPNERTTGR